MTDQEVNQIVNEVNRLCAVFDNIMAKCGGDIFQDEDVQASPAVKECLDNLAAIMRVGKGGDTDETD